jgi:crossover junction endodeoxyribonuclease RusA
MILNLPYPPSVNTYWRANGKRRFISKEGVAFKKAVIEYVVENELSSLGEARLAVHITVHPRSKRRFDIDNVCKAILDSMMAAGLYDDDSQIDWLTVKRGEQTVGGGCSVIIGTING